MKRTMRTPLAVIACLVPVVGSASAQAPAAPPVEQPVSVQKLPADRPVRDPCSLLQSPAMRMMLSGAFETKLMIQCGEIPPYALQQRRETVWDDGFEALLGADILVNDPTLDVGGTTQSETSVVAVGNTVCAAWNDAGEGLGANGFSGFGFSLDGGSTFTDGGPFPNGPGDTNFGDPSLAFSVRDNTLYYAALSTVGLSMWSSVDNCQSFNYVGPIHAGTGDDKELIAVDNDPTSPFYGRIYVGWTDFSLLMDRNVTSFSDDGGLTWSVPVSLPGSGTSGQGMWPAVAPNGDVYFALLARSFVIGGLQSQLIYQSVDGGNTWTQMTDIATNQLRPENVAASTACFRQALNPDIRNLSSPQIVIHQDAAAPAGYVIHAVYPYDSDGAGPDESNVFYRRSDDGAVTWSAEVLLNDDGGTTDQWFPAIGANAIGTLVASWYDRRLDPGGNLMFDRYAARSTDGGLTWEPNIRVSDVSSPVSQNLPHFDGLANCYHGDYDQVAVGVSTAHVVWSDDRRITGTGPNPDVYYDQLSVNLPPVAICQDVEKEADANCEAEVTPEEVDDGSFDPEGFPVTLSLSPAGPFPLGDTMVTLTVTDDQGQTDTCDATVTVVDVTDPVVTPPAPITLECNSTGGVPVGDSDVQDWLALATAIDNCDGALPVTNDAPPLFPSGCPPGQPTTVTFSATDSSGNTGSAQSDLTVQDTTPPEISCAVATSELWPPNHSFVDVGLSADAMDTCDGMAPAIEITVTSDEHPATEKGAGGPQHCPDAIVGDDGSVQLRAERSGSGDGRVYVITTMATDSCGNVATCDASVGVPHNRGPGGDPIDSGQLFDPTVCD